MTWNRNRAARAAQVACVVVGVLSTPLALNDVLRWGQLLVAQMTGPAPGSDFLNLYTGAALVVHDPAATYSLDVQRQLQSGIAASDVPLVPFYLPPYAAVLIAPLGWLPYWLAYLVWLAINVACLWAAAVLLVPPVRRPRHYALAWCASALLVLPVFLAIVQGQTSALMLLGFALVIASSAGGGPVRTAFGGLTWLFKPQFAPWLLALLVLQRRVRALMWLGLGLAVLSAIALALFGPSGLATYAALSTAKTQESLTADPGYLPGPTLLHVAQVLVGPGGLANAIALVLIAIAVVLMVRLWRGGLADTSAVRSLQLASVPIAAVICAPYALVHELTLWLAAFWLVFPLTADSPPLRTGMWALAAAIWLAGDIGVALPSYHGADAAALLGLCALLGLALARDHVQRVSTRA